MKKTLVTSGLIMVALLLSLSATYADLPGGGWWTAEQIQAIGGDDTTVAFTAYGDTAADDVVCGSTVLDDGEAVVYMPVDWLEPNCADMPEGWRGAAVVSADKEIVAVVEETNQDAGGVLGVSGGTADASYRGISGSEAATTLSFPAYKSDHAGETSTFYIQNTGSAATTLRATFQECAATTPGCSGTGATYVYTLTTAVEPNRMTIIMPGDAAGMPTGDGYFGGLMVESLDGQPLAGVVNEHATTTTGPATYLKSTRAFVGSEYDTTLYAPAIKKTYPQGAGALSKWSALQIQNVGSGPGDFVVTYNIAIGDRQGQEIVDDTTCVDIPVGQTCFVMTLFPVDGSGTAQLLDGEYAAATVTGDQDMVAVVNEETIFSHPVASAKQYATYSAVPDSAAATAVSVPAYKEEWVGRIMGVTAMSVDGDADITATIKNANLDVKPDDLVATYSSVAQGNAVTFLLLSRGQAQALGAVVDSGDPNDFMSSNNSMTLSSTGRIAVIVNQENSYLTGPAVPLDAANYEGFPLD
jgi:hypothetical protein